MSDSLVLPPMKSPVEASTGVRGDGSSPITVDLGSGASGKDFMIGGGVLLILSVVFFLIRNAFANYLVGALKRSPNNASMAAWGLFGGLLFGTAIGCIAIVNKSFLTAIYVAPLAILSCICFGICFMATSRK